MKVLEQAENRFILRDRKGQVRAALRVKARGRRELSLYDRQGNMRGGMTVRADGTTTLSLFGPGGHTRVFLTKHGDWPANLFLYEGECRVALGVPDYASEELSFHTLAGFPFVVPGKARGGRPYLELWGVNCGGVIFLARDDSVNLALRSKKKVSAGRGTSRRSPPASRAGREILRVMISVEPDGVARLILRHRNRRLRGVLRVDADGELRLDLDD